MTRSTSLRKLVLFDIDGTILTGDGIWAKCFLEAIQAFFPDISVPPTSFAGRTDLLIAREILRAGHVERGMIEKSLPEIIALYLEKSHREARSRKDEITVFPGIREVLGWLHEDGNVVLGLLTGNVKAGAEIKLSCVNLDHYFSMGVYGDDHWDRYLLPALAVTRAHELFGRKFQGKEVIIIGDTIHDVNCGKSIGVKSIAVGTGRGVTRDELLAQEPDFYFPDFSETAEVVKAILE